MLIDIRLGNQYGCHNCGIEIEHRPHLHHLPVEDKLGDKLGGNRGRQTIYHQGLFFMQHHLGTGQCLLRCFQFQQARLERKGRAGQCTVPGDPI